VYTDTVVPPVLSAYSEAIIVNSYSKSLSLPGERIGYIAVAPNMSDKEDMINGLIYATRILGYVNAPALMQRIVAELVPASVDVSIYKRRLDTFTAVLDSAGIEYLIPQGAFYLFCKVPRRRNPSPNLPTADMAKESQPPDNSSEDMAFVNHLKQHLILGVPGSSFGKSGWMRLAYCVDEKTIRASQAAFKTAMENW
jgi:aspartate aminotransferase